MQVQATATIGWGSEAGEQPAGLGRVVVRRDDGSRFVVPVPIQAKVLDADWDVRLVIDWDPDLAELVIVQLEMSRQPAGPPIDPRAVRVPRLGEARDKAIAALAHDVDSHGFYRDFSLPPEEVRTTLRAPRKRTRRDEAIEAEVLRAAELYEEGRVAERTDLVMHVSRNLPASRSTAHRRIKAARDAGLIPEGH